MCVRYTMPVKLSPHHSLSWISHGFYVGFVMLSSGSISGENACCRLLLLDLPVAESFGTI